MPPLPPQCFVEMRCPFCGDPPAAQFVHFANTDTPDMTWFRCTSCFVHYTSDVFKEKVAEVIQAEKENHRFWRRISEALS